MTFDLDAYVSSDSSSMRVRGDPTKLQSEGGEPKILVFSDSLIVLALSYGMSDIRLSRLTLTGRKVGLLVIIAMRGSVCLSRTDVGPGKSAVPIVVRYQYSMAGQWKLQESGRKRSIDQHISTSLLLSPTSICMYLLYR